MRPVMKTVPWLREGEEVVVALNPAPGDLRRFPDSGGAVARVMEAADGTRTAEQIAEAAGVPAGEADAILADLDDAGLLVDAGSVAGLLAAYCTTRVSSLFKSFSVVSGVVCPFDVHLSDALAIGGRFVEGLAWCGHLALASPSVNWSC